MFYTFLSLLVLVIAPLLERLSRGKQAFEHTLASFLIVVLGGIVLFEIIPLSYSTAGWITIPLILLGLSGPSLIEKLFRKAADSTHQVTLLIGICGLLCLGTASWTNASNSSRAGGNRRTSDWLGVHPG